MKDKFSKIIQGVSDAKNKAEQFVKASKTVVEKARDVISGDAISQGLEATSKGAKMAAKGAKLASKSADSLANTLEKASSGIKKMGEKLKK